MQFPTLPIIGATLENLSWLEGRWKGLRDGNHFEEHWTSAIHNSMMGMFRWFDNDKPEFYEIQTLTKENEKIILRIKHFDTALSSWEDKHKSLVFQLVEVSHSHLLFCRPDSSENFWIQYKYQPEHEEMIVHFYSDAEERKAIRPFVFKRQK